MASRPQMPSYGDIQDSTNPASDALDFVLGEPKEDYEVVDTPAPSMSATTSSNPKKPRTIRAGYDQKTQTLTVVFRDGTWWDYRGVPKNMWETFKAAESKGRYLRESGLDTWDDMGPSDIGGMSAGRRALLNDISKFADRMYGSGNSEPSVYSIEPPSRRKK